MVESRRLIEEAKIRFGDPAGLVKAYSKSQAQQGMRADRLNVDLGSFTKRTNPNRYGRAIQQTISKRGRIDKSGNISISSSVNGGVTGQTKRKATFSDIFNPSGNGFNPGSGGALRGSGAGVLFGLSVGALRGSNNGGEFLKNFEREVESIDSILSGESTPDVERKKTKGLPMFEGRRFFQSLGNLRSLSSQVRL